MASSAFAEAPSYLHVNQLNYAGSGCFQNSVSVVTTEDRQALRFLFDQFVAEVGPGIPLSYKRNRNVTASQSTSLYFQGFGASAALRTSLVGPVDSDYVLKDVLSPSALVWSPCRVNRALNLNTQVVLDASRASRSAHGLYTLEEEMIWKYALVWKRC